MDETKRKEVLDTVSKLRVTDIRDGMDWVGLHHVGTVDPAIHALYPAKAAGFARTYKHIPTQRRVPELSPEDYTKWAYEYWYDQLWDYNAMRLTYREGDFLVVDTMGQNTPAVGSMDGMIWAAIGIKGVLTNGGTRDVDEQLIQKALPVWHRHAVQVMYQGRVEFGGDGDTVEIGGALVCPGDLVVADLSGALVVPIEHVENVLKYAIQEAENDRYDRSLLYEALGLEPDDSVKSVFDVPPHPYRRTNKNWVKEIVEKTRANSQA